MNRLPNLLRCLGAVVMVGVVSQALAAGPLDDRRENTLNVDPDDEVWKEQGYEMPGAPDPASYVGFFVNATSTGEFFIDRSHLSIGEDGIVRYVLIVRSPSGAESATFEGIRCDTRERRLYASWHAKGGWAPLKNSNWQRMGQSAYNRPRAVLAEDYFCDGNAPPRDRKAALIRLEGGAEYTDPRNRMP
ncbi:CNP1-like family protein [Azoarcus sp. TTM-91]|uniref:CNP1-like family protein n=1 Tax=Azoarcus sp. TTM-91 TaxID=2691581 RepID=UPI002006E982|nr:CNP1-like family protein [Azoarcus sp. TTM-91]